MRTKPGKKWSRRRRRRFSTKLSRERKSGYRDRRRSGRRRSARTLRGQADSPVLYEKEHDLIMDSESENPSLEGEEQENSSGMLESSLRDAYEAGYREGYFEGGEGIVTRLLPPNMIMPGVTVEGLIASGIRQLAPEEMIPLLPPHEVARALQDAMDDKLHLSVIRLGDGELLTLAHDTILPVEEVRKRGPFLPYSGVELPAHSIREALADALRKADIIGVPQSRHPSFQGLLLPVFRHYGLNPASLRLTSSTVNYALEEEGLLLPLLQGRKVLIVGNRAEGLALALQPHDIEISGLITPVRGVHDTELVVRAASGYAFDIALVAAGIAAVLICTEIASRLGKPAFDFGHLANKLESGA
ncbi:GT-D fold domain-containing protein [Paenibacillus antibioticophila]|uniref:GT-D fold domain-containing protein n=1 Tax=Paenibacillus antibioticophila TaxID=1274374 RepID=UPI000B18CD4B|nr:GT-D fold domain-containing glycosyltransferase [Paenibacillus antibioticophila]